MVTLSLFRHAKSAWDNPGLGDFDRPLAPRGEKDAPRMGRYMAREGLEPELVLCSSAVRARQTLELAQAQWSGSSEIRFMESLYHAGPGEMLRALKAIPASCAHAMLVGHNPGMHSLAITLCGNGEAGAMESLDGKFPTAALAVVKFEGDWQSIAQGGGYLHRFVVPRSLR